MQNHTELFITDEMDCADNVSSSGGGDQEGGSGLFYAHRYIKRIAFDIGMIIGSSLATLKHNYLRLFQPLPQ